MTPYDAWLTNDEPWTPDDDGEEYRCPRCGHAQADHPYVRETDEDGNDWETIACPD